MDKMSKNGDLVTNTVLSHLLRKQNYRLIEVFKV